MAIQGRTSSFCPRIPDWVGDSIGFLKDVFGELTTEGMTKPRYKARVDGDQDAFLSFDCTIGRIFSRPAAKEAIQPLIDRMRREIRPDRPDMTLEEMLDSLKRMTLRDLCMENQIPISPEMEEALEKVPNI